MSSLIAFGGKDILNMTLAKFYQQNLNFFKGMGTTPQSTYSFEVTKTPVATLVVNGTGPKHNVKINMNEVRVSVVPRIGLQFNSNVKMVALALASISGGVLYFTEITVQIDGPVPTQSGIQGIINNSIVPIIQSALMATPLPQLQQLFGTSFSLRVGSGEVINGPAIEVGANVVNHSNFRNADPPSNNDLSSLNAGSATNALVIGLASARAVNFLINELLKPVSHDFFKELASAGVKGNISSSVPTLVIQNGVGKASVDILTQLEAGIKILNNWQWVKISVPAVNLVVSNKLVVVDKKGVLELTGVSRINLDFDLPSVLSPVESVINNIINAILVHFKTMIKDALAEIVIPIFELPCTIPGTNFGITLSFTNAGLSYRSRSVQAIIRLKD